MEELNKKEETLWSKDGASWETHDSLKKKPSFENMYRILVDKKAIQGTHIFHSPNVWNTIIGWNGMLISCRVSYRDQQILNEKKLDTYF